MRIHHFINNKDEFKELFKKDCVQTNLKSILNHVEPDSLWHFWYEHDKHQVSSADFIDFFSFCHI